MIRHFEKIEKLGVFSKYKRSDDAKQFERFNLIYGLNGSGKTTLSRFFHDLNTGEAAGFPDLKYKITTDEGAFVQSQPYSKKIRVFNSEYVEANIGELEGKLNPIFVIGEENKELAKSIDNDEKELVQRLEKQADLSEKISLFKKERGKIFTSIASEISENAQGGRLRTYRKPNAEKAFDNLDGYIKLSPEDLAVQIQSLKQEALSEVSKVELGSVPLKSDNGQSHQIFDTVQVLEKQISALTLQSANSIALARLVQNPNIAKWVEDGFELHTRSEDQVCEYCQQPIPDDRKIAIESHFNDSDQQLKSKIEMALHDLELIRSSFLSFPAISKSNFYGEFHARLDELYNSLQTQRTGVLKHIDELSVLLRTKLTRRTESYAANLPTFSVADFPKFLSEYNDIVDTNNAKSKDYDTHVQSASIKIEAHFLSTIAPQVKELDEKVETANKDLDDNSNGDPSADVLGIEALKKRIDSNRQKISNAHKAAGDLSKKLESFLGRDDLKFVAEGDGYRIERFGRPAQRLSEGEKTAITFLYFVVQLNDQDFDITQGIVVIDDPVSSLDSSSVYQAFAFMKNAVKEAEQVFLLTHNFDFLKLLLDWFRGISGAANKKSHWMLHCENTASSQRETTLKPLDKILLEHKNEQTYLIKILTDFKSDGTIATAYPIPNIVRKVLETFLEQHSTGIGFYKQLENLDFDSEKKSALYKYANDLSHPTLSGLDPALVGETQTNVTHLLEMIETIAPVHFKALIETINA